jgi:hypothetical protein
MRMELCNYDKEHLHLSVIIQIEKVCIVAREYIIGNSSGYLQLFMGVNRTVIGIWMILN